MKNLNELAKEINTDWSSEYLALVEGGELRVQHNHVVVAIVDESLDFEMLENGYVDVFDQLQYMIER